MTLIAVSISCRKVQEYLSDTQAIKSDLNLGMPGTAIQDMDIDNNNQFYFVTWKSDFAVENPTTSIPLRYYLSRKISENSRFEILDSNFVHVDKILFDRNNNLWSINYHGLFLRKNGKCEPIINLDFDKGEGIFTCLAVDRNNNIWAGGMQTGLYKIDEHLNITKYTVENSKLASKSMESILVDESNTVWIALYGTNSVLKISGNNWTNYDSPGQISQTIWSLVSDKDGNLWIGKGWADLTESLVRFNGNIWETINPRNEMNEMVPGVVRQLYSDKNRIYAVVESNEAPFSAQLLTFDGANWNKIYGLPYLSNMKSIADLKIDFTRRVVWISISNEGIYKLNF